MSPELLNLIVNAGGTGVLLWLVWEMRQEAKDERKRTWALLDYLISNRGKPIGEITALKEALGPKPTL